MKKYFAYIRVSTVKQGERGSSLQEQRSAIETFAQRNNLNITEWFEERETAAKQGRRMFITMLTRLERGEAAGIIIHKIDRGARNLRDWARLGELIDRGVPVHFANDNMDLQSRGGRLSADIQAVVAADFIRNLRDEVKKGFYGRLKQGFYPLGAPVGYLDCGGGKKKEVDPEMGPLIRKAFELYAENRMSIEELRAELMRRGLKTRRGHPISFNGLCGVLHNPFYMGIMRIERTNESFPGCHEPLISKALFDRVQKVLADKTHSMVIKHDFEFRRFIKCAACGRHLTGERKKGRFVYYRCYKPSCRSSVVKEQAIYAALKSAFSLVHLSKREFGDFGDLAREGSDDANAAAAAERKKIQVRLAKCEELLGRLTDALLSERIPKDVFDERRLASLRERQDLLDQLADTHSEQAPSETVLNYLELPFIKQIGPETPLPGQNRKFAETLAWNLVADGEKLAFRLRTPYRAIVEWRLSEKGGPYCDTVGTRVRQLLDILIDGAIKGLSDRFAANASELTFIAGWDGEPSTVASPRSPPARRSNANTGAVARQVPKVPKSLAVAPPQMVAPIEQRAPH